MKIKKISILFLLIVSSFMFQVSGADESKNTPTNQRTNGPTHQMLFWYPGEAGTTEEAQAPLDAFFEYVNTKTAPDKITGKYFNTVEGGVSFIKQARPKFGIISFAAYQMNGASLGQNSVLMQTLPLPDGKPVERYVVVGKGPAPKDWTAVTLYSKQPLTSAFVEKYILPFKSKGVQTRVILDPKGAKDSVNALDPSPPEADQDDKKKLTTVSNILPALKDIAAGTKSGGVILQPIEYFTLKNMQQPWVKELIVWHTSQDIPSAPLVVFGAEDSFAQKFKAALLNMSNDPQGKAILETLRLKGFQAQN